MAAVAAALAQGTGLHPTGLFTNSEDSPPPASDSNTGEHLGATTGSREPSTHCQNPGQALREEPHMAPNPHTNESCHRASSWAAHTQKQSGNATHTHTHCTRTGNQGTHQCPGEWCYTEGNNNNAGNRKVPQSGEGGSKPASAARPAPCAMLTCTPSGVHAAGVRWQIRHNSTCDQPAASWLAEWMMLWVAPLVTSRDSRGEVASRVQSHGKHVSGVQHNVLARRVRACRWR